MANLLPWIILLAPLVSSVLITLFLKRFRTLSTAGSIAAVLVSLIGSCIVFATSEPITPASLSWLDFGSLFQVSIGLHIDQLSKGMLMVVTIIGSLVHIYSLSYMAEDEG